MTGGGPLAVIVVVATPVGATVGATPGGVAVDASRQVITGVIGREVLDALAGVIGGEVLGVIVGVVGDVGLGVMVGATVGAEPGASLRVNFGVAGGIAALLVVDAASVVLGMGDHDLEASAAVAISGLPRGAARKQVHHFGQLRQA